MTKTLTLAHISDVHLTPIGGVHLRYWNAKRALGYLNWRGSRRHVHKKEIADALAADALAQGADHIAVTGDLVHLGLPCEYDHALAWLRTLGSPERVSVVPGNHDIYTRRMHGSSCLEEWGPYMAPCAWGSSFASHAGGSFPYVRRLGSVALIGVNSALPRPPFVAAGRVGAQQLGRVAHLLERLGAEGLARVIMIHHPPLPGQAPHLKALADARLMQDVITMHGAELVLHGHNHRDMLTWVSSRHGRVPVIGVASGSAASRHKGEPLARYRLFKFIPRHGRLEVEMITRGFGASEDGIHEIDRLTLDHSRPSP